MEAAARSGACAESEGGRGSARIVVVTSADLYRQLARKLPGREDTVLEIGCSTGEATRLLALSGARVVAVDVAADMVAQLHVDPATPANVTVAHVDARDGPRLRAVASRPDLVFIDIGGDARLDNVAMLLRHCLRAFAPRVVVVRSRELAALASQVAAFELPEGDGLGLAEERQGVDPELANLLDLAESSSAKCRIFAARRLRGLTDPLARQRLQELAGDVSHKVRRAARLGRQGAHEDGAQAEVERAS